MSSDIDLDYLHSELLECSRYGEADDLKAMLEDANKKGASFDINFCDGSGSTAMHKV